MIRTETHEEIHTLWLEKGSANALDTEFLRRIAAEVEDLSAEPGRGLVLASEGPIFCAGLDLPALVGLGREEIADLVDALVSCVVSLFSFPRPTVASINGHAIAGGALLTMACDQRHMLMGNAKWGLNEAQLGLAMPPATVEVLRYGLPRKTLEKVLYGGGLYPAFKAHDMGILDELVEEGSMAEAAAASIRRWTASVSAFADIKARLHAPTLEEVQRLRSTSDDWVDLWFSDEVQTRLKEVVAQLQTKSSDQG